MSCSEKNTGLACAFSGLKSSFEVYLLWDSADQVPLSKAKTKQKKQTNKKNHYGLSIPNLKTQNLKCSQFETF
jgi:hypothetical protein